MPIFEYNIRCKNCKSKGFIGSAPRNRTIGEHPIDVWYDVLWMKVANGTYLCQFVNAWLLLSFKIRAEAACDLSTTLIVCRCFGEAWENSISSSFVSSCRSSDTNWVHKSDNILFGYSGGWKSWKLTRRRLLQHWPSSTVLQTSI